MTHFYFLNLLTWYEVETNTENNPCLIGKSWISSCDIFRKRFLVRKLYVMSYPKMLTSCIVSHQGLSMVKVSTLNHVHQKSPTYKGWSVAWSLNPICK